MYFSSQIKPVSSAKTSKHFWGLCLLTPAMALFRFQGEGAGIHSVRSLPQPHLHLTCHCSVERPGGQPFIITLPNLLE